jgi:hypothetical protein
MRVRIPMVGISVICAAPLLVASGAQAGLLTAAATNCEAPALTQPFAPWGDQSSYMLVPNGDFEAGTSGWSLDGGAGLVSGAEPWKVTNTSESESLALPAGSSATSPPSCVAMDDPTIRFFALNTGASNSRLTVTVTVTTSLGISLTLPIGSVSSDGNWAPTPTNLMVVNLLTLGSNTPVEFGFNPSGNGAWQIDDVYVDPYGRS